MAEPYRAKSLATLIKQINAEFPDRSKISDGWIGDKAHANRKSDHNPDPDGAVRAMDITHDPVNGVSGRALAEALVASRDPRILNIISNRQIISGPEGPSPWVWRAYGGANPHTHHMHISVRKGNIKNDDSRWNIALGKPNDDEIAEAVATVERPVLKVGSKGDYVKEAQRALLALGYELGKARDDGDFGTKTEKAVRAFQKANKLVADGRVGVYTWSALLKP